MCLFILFTGIVAVVVDVVPALGGRCRTGELSGDALLTILMIAEPLVLVPDQRIIRIGRMSTLNASVAHAGTQGQSDHWRKRFVAEGQRQIARLCRARRVWWRSSADLRRQDSIQTGLADWR